MHVFYLKSITSLPCSSGTVSWVCRAASQISTSTLEARQSGTTFCEEERSVSSIDINVWPPLVFQEKLPLHWETDICFQPCCHNRSKYDHGLTVCPAFQLYVNIVWKAHECLGSFFFLCMYWPQTFGLCRCFGWFHPHHRIWRCMRTGFYQENRETSSWGISVMTARE